MPHGGNRLLGEILALSAAMSWAFSVILFKRSERISPGGINLYKNVVASVLLTVTLFAVGGTIDWDRSSEDWWRLCVSGVLGIAIADTLFFMALRRLGAGLLAIVDCVYAPMLVIGSVLFLGEPLTMQFIVGGLLVLGGVLWATTDSKILESIQGLSRRDLRIGSLLGVSGIAFMVAGILLVKPALPRGGLIEVSLIRLVTGVLAQLCWVAFRAEQRSDLHVLRPQPVWKTLFPAAFLGTYISMLFWIGGFKWANASVAAVLNQMSVVFIILLARIFLNEPLTQRRMIGALGALGGAVLVLLQ